MLTASADTAVSALAKQGINPGQSLTSGDGFEQSVAVWNADGKRTPALVVRCASPAQVQGAVRVAAACALALPVRGAGHDSTRRALRGGGLVIDLSPTHSVDIRGEVATVHGGARSIDLITSAERRGLTAAVGSWSAVGLAGLATRGGYGPLLGRLGSATSDLLGADVVLADGYRIVADARHKPEPFWALRGGGGNFGVITTLTVGLHSPATVRSDAAVFRPRSRCRATRRCPHRASSHGLRGGAAARMEARGALRRRGKDPARHLAVQSLWQDPIGTSIVIAPMTRNGTRVNRSVPPAKPRPRRTDLRRRHVT